MKTLYLLILQFCTFTVFSQSTYIVDSTSNTSGTLSIYSAISQASAGDTIAFSSQLKGDTITLYNGQLIIDKNLVLKGNGFLETIISGNNSSRIFLVNSGVSLALIDMKLIDGYANGGNYIERSGGAILNQGTLISNRVLFAGNEAVTVGGAIYTNASASFKNCVLSGNKSSSEGGGIHNADDASCTIINCTITGNEGSSGGGIFNGFSSTMDLGNSVVALNSLNAGGFNDIEDLNGINYIGSNHIYTSGFGVPSSGNGVDPLFIENASTAPSTDGNFEPKAYSPLIDQGTDTTGLSIGNIDLIKLPRVKSTKIDLGAFEVQKSGSVWEVTNATDGSLGSLRYIFERYLENDTVTFSANLNGIEIEFSNGQFEIDSNLAIIGNGTSQTILDANKLSRHFNLLPNKTLHLEGLSLMDGKVNGNGGAIFNDNGSLSLIDVHFKNDSASFGGAIYDKGNIVANRVVISGNWNYGLFKVSGSLYLKNSEISGNTKYGVYFTSSTSASMSGCTVANNESIGIYNTGIDLHLSNTICAGNQFVDVFIESPGTIVDGGFNFIQNPGGGHGITMGNNIKPYFTEPQNTFPIPTATGDYTLEPCSYAVNRGLNDTTGFDLGIIDAAQNLRISGSRIDIGAYEFTGTPTANLYTVTNNLNDGCGSLRQILTGTDLSDTVRFSTLLNGQPFVITSEVIKVKNHPMKLKGNGRSETILDGGGVQQILDLDFGSDFYLSDLTLSNGFGNVGGAIYNRGNLEIDKVTFTNNNSDGSGGAIYNTGTCVVKNSSFFSNNAPIGGGIYNVMSLEVLKSEFKGNESSIIGAGMYSERFVTVKGSLFTGNKAQDGAAILISSLGSPNTVLINNTIAKNEGRGVYITGDAFMAKNGMPGSFSDLQLFEANLTDGGGNYVTDDVNDHPFTYGNNVDPLFMDDNITTPALIGDFRPLPSSPLINSGTPDTTGLNLSSINITGKPRIYGSAIDIGAFEFQCPKASSEVLNITAAITAGPQYHRATKITANSSISASDLIGLRGYKDVVLLPGFEAESSSVFEASIEENCFE
ncbi:choice-of-anchor Q domain-containing protein [Jiulongibacter sp. NS-SX5]|uniref:choice-of-anchor Q domain-containing protein n=1 Tax=Jiulongibacter sp. NS-SX5 TaxID=3463854 RepID=UPI0040599E1D